MKRVWDDDMILSPSMKESEDTVNKREKSSKIAQAVETASCQRLDFLRDVAIQQLAMLSSSKQQGMQHRRPGSPSSWIHPHSQQSHEGPDRHMALPFAQPNADIVTATGRTHKTAEIRYTKDGMYPAASASSSSLPSPALLNMNIHHTHNGDGKLARNTHRHEHVVTEKSKRNGSTCNTSNTTNTISNKTNLHNNSVSSSSETKQVLYGYDTHAAKITCKDPKTSSSSSAMEDSNPQETSHHNNNKRSRPTAMMMTASSTNSTTSSSTSLPSNHKLLLRKGKWTVRCCSTFMLFFCYYSFLWGFYFFIFSPLLSLFYYYSLA